MRKLSFISLICAVVTLCAFQSSERRVSLQSIAPSRGWSPYAQMPHNHYRMDGMMPQKMADCYETKASVTGHRILVILAQFSDIRFTYRKSDFNDLLNKPGYSVKGARDCAAKYIEAQLGFLPSIVVTDTVTLSKERHYYGENNYAGGSDKHPGEMVAEACQKVHDRGEVNFAEFDEDKDGYVDRVFVFYAGEDESQQMVDAYGKRQNEDFLRSHSHTLENSDYGKCLELDGVKINRYACTSELYRVYSRGSEFTDKMAPIGTFCHELFHSFGLPDIYDTDYALSGGTAAAFWRKLSLMDAGNNNASGNVPPNLSAPELEILGLKTPEDLRPGEYTMSPLGTEGSAIYRIVNPADADEYFLFEFRDSLGWDTEIGGQGMLAYHIDKSKRCKMASEVYKDSLTSADRWNIYDEVNCRPGIIDENGNFSHTKESHQCADLVEADGRCDVNPSKEAFADIRGVFFPGLGVTGLGGSSPVSLTFWDGTKPSLAITSIVRSEGKLTFLVEDMSSPIPPDPENPPKEDDPLYIILVYSEAPQSGAVKSGTGIQMKVNNTVGAAGVRWFFNDKTIGDAGKFTASVSGEIRAEIQWSDGDVDYLFKYLNVE